MRIFDFALYLGAAGKGDAPSQQEGTFQQKTERTLQGPTLEEVLRVVTVRLRPAKNTISISKHERFRDCERRVV